MADTYSALFWAYLAIWILIFSYLFFLSREQNQLRKKIDQLEKELK